MIEKLFEKFSILEQVQTITLGGSHFGKVYDEK